MIEDLTLITCSYNTPIITETMLKSFKQMHSELSNMNILIIENSTNNETQLILDSNKISYIKNPGGTHSKSLDNAFRNCKTKYALVVDTDIIFKRNVTTIFKKIKESNVHLCGIACGDRGGFKLMPRIHPWFMFVDVEEVRNNNIKFHDKIRIKNTRSELFYGNCPINNIISTHPMYDVGCSFYEDIKNANLNICNIPSLENWFVHYEGSSWQRNSDDAHFKELGKQVWDAYQKEIWLTRNINIDNYYI